MFFYRHVESSADYLLLLFIIIHGRFYRERYTYIDESCVSIIMALVYGNLKHLSKKELLRGEKQLSMTWIEPQMNTIKYSNAH